MAEALQPPFSRLVERAINRGKDQRYMALAVASAGLFINAAVQILRVAMSAHRGDAMLVPNTILLAITIALIVVLPFVVRWQINRENIREA